MYVDIRSTILLLIACISWLVNSGCLSPTAQHVDLSAAKTPMDELKTFQLEDGFSIQLVASEPMIEDPVLCQFDEYNRLWVVEMRGFMNDIDGKTESEKTGRISILSDTNQDGRMDVKHIYIDSLILPRALGLFSHGVLIAENNSLWISKDQDGDGRSDTKLLLDSQYAKNGLPEHSDNGLWRNLDNWVYNAKSTFRYKYVDGRWTRDSTEFRGQWGLSHDDEGRLVYNYNWSQLHGDLVPPNYLTRNKNHKPSFGFDHGLTTDRRVYPIRPTPAVNRGYIEGTLDANGSILEFTAACSPYFFRSYQLGDAYYGNVFVAEPSGNLVKRNITQSTAILRTASDPHPGKEFLASTDERFRPVHFTSGPDGALYVVDMYRGLIQHGAYVTPYLREQTLERNLIGPVHCGRIWRITPKNKTIQYLPPAATLTTAQLVKALTDSNGWYRDMAQRLLIEKNDPSCIPLLIELVKTSAKPLSKVHALWTLEGLKHIDIDILIASLKDRDYRVSASALRILEQPMLKNKQVQTLVGRVIKDMLEELPLDKSLQTSLSATFLNKQDRYIVLSAILSKYTSQPLIRETVMSSLESEELDFLSLLLKDSTWKKEETNKTIFVELLSSAIMKSGQTSAVNHMFHLLHSLDTSWIAKPILTGMTITSQTLNKPLKLTKKPLLFTTSFIKQQPAFYDKLAAKLEWPGHSILIDTSKVKTKLTPQEYQSWANGRQLYLNTCSGCHHADGTGTARMAPGLIGSDWVTGDKKRLSLIILHGLEGPIHVNGKLYDKPEILPVMPSFSTMDDASIASVLTYIRNEWGNQAGAMDRRTVSMTRVLTQGRVKPWNPTDLKIFIEAQDTTKNK